MSRDRYRYVVTCAVSHMFYTYGPLSADEVGEIERRIQEDPTDPEGILDAIDDVDSYDAAVGIDTWYGDPEVTHGLDGTSLAPDAPNECRLCGDDFNNEDGGPRLCPSCAYKEENDD